MRVEEGSPADDAGLEPGEEKIDFQGQQDIPEGGDAIVGVDGRRLDREDDLADLISLKRAGERVRLEVMRGGQRRTVEVELGERPDRLPRP